MSDDLIERLRAMQNKAASDAADELELRRRKCRVYRKALRDLNKAHATLWKMVFLYYDQRERK